MIASCEQSSSRFNPCSMAIVWIVRFSEVCFVSEFVCCVLCAVCCVLCAVCVIVIPLQFKCPTPTSRQCFSQHHTSFKSLKTVPGARQYSSTCNFCACCLLFPLNAAQCCWIRGIERYFRTPSTSVQLNNRCTAGQTQATVRVK